MHRLKIPLSDRELSDLNVGDEILVSGVVFTARDKAHTFLLENYLSAIEGSTIFHCGPIVKDNEVIAAGPTTSARFNKYTPALIEEYQIKSIIGKGGMSDTVVKALKGRAVYFSAIGGTAAVNADKMKVKNLYKKEFGMPEAIWELEIKDLPVIVAVDTKGNNLYKKVYDYSKSKLEILLNKK